MLIFATTTCLAQRWKLTAVVLNTRPCWCLQDFSIFPQQVRSFKSAQSSKELSITDRICELVAKGVDDAAPTILERKRNILQ